MEERGENISNYITWEVKSSRQTTSPWLPVQYLVVVAVVVVVRKILSMSHKLIQQATLNQVGLFNKLWTFFKFSFAI